MTTKAPHSPEVAESLGLAGLTVYPAPEVSNIVATIHQYIQERQRQLKDGTSVEDTLIFAGATTAHVKAIFPDDGETNPFYPNIVTFLGDQPGLLFIRMLDSIHGTANIDLQTKIRIWLSNIGLEDYCRSYISKTNHAYCFRPYPQRQTPNNSSPTLVLEAGNGQSRLPLYYKNWWFNNSPPNSPRGDVKVVIIITVFHPLKRIVIEQWQRDCETPTQSVLIKPKPGVAFSTEMGAWDHWVVEGGPLRIKFEDVFLRSKQGGQESDFVLAELDLTRLAINTWGSGEE